MVRHQEAIEDNWQLVDGTVLGWVLEVFIGLEYTKD